MSARPPTTILDAALAIAIAAESNAVALIEAAQAIRHVAEHVHDLHEARDPFEGMTKQ